MALGIDIITESRGKLDLILLDIMMPVVDGVKMLEIAKSNPLTQHIPVLVASYLLSKETLSHCLQIGAVDVSSPLLMVIFHVPPPPHDDGGGKQKTKRMIVTLLVYPEPENS